MLKSRNTQHDVEPNVLRQYKTMRETLKMDMETNQIQNGGNWMLRGLLRTHFFVLVRSRYTETRHNNIPNVQDDMSSFNVKYKSGAGNSLSG